MSEIRQFGSSVPGSVLPWHQTEPAATSVLQAGYQCGAERLHYVFTLVLLCSVIRVYLEESRRADGDQCRREPCTCCRRCLKPRRGFRDAHEGAVVAGSTGQISNAKKGEKKTFSVN